MSKQLSSENRKPLIDATPKKTIKVVVSSDVSDDELRRELDRLQASLDRIREKHYSSCASLSRIQSRRFADIIRAHLYVRRKKSTNKRIKRPNNN